MKPQTTMTHQFSDKKILADGRWIGMNGIGRFAGEVLSRLKNIELLTTGPKPLSLRNILWQYQRLQQAQQLYFTPGFNPVFNRSIPYVITIHDLIHLHYAERLLWLKKGYYEIILKPCLRHATKIITVSEYSKQCIIDWLHIPATQVVVAGNGVSDKFTPQGPKATVGSPYFLHVGNTKQHKNIARLLQAFAQAKIDANVKLVMTAQLSPALKKLAHSLQLADRIVLQPKLTDEILVTYYRSAIALILPSLYEGFGLPIVEAMASGTPVITSNVTSMPEVAGDAALLIDPYSVDSIAKGLERMYAEPSLREELIAKGLVRAQNYTWDKTAGIIQRVLNELS